MGYAYLRSSKNRKTSHVIPGKFCLRISMGNMLLRRKTKTGFCSRSDIFAIISLYLTLDGELLLVVQCGSNMTVDC